MKKSYKIITCSIAAAISLAFAVQSLASTPPTGLSKINSIITSQKDTIVEEITSGNFAPNETITLVQGIRLIANAVGLDPDLQKFKVEPEYMNTYLDPKKKLTREEFFYLLVHAVKATGKMPMFSMTVEAYNSIVDKIKDHDQINELFAGYIYYGFSTHIVKLDDQGRFNPHATITRAEVAEELSNAIEIMNHIYPPASLAEGIEIITDMLELDPNLQKVELQPDIIPSSETTNTVLIDPIDPNKKLTREEFTDMLMTTLYSIGKLPPPKDANPNDTRYTRSMLAAVSTGIVESGADPAAEITRLQAIEEVRNALEAIKK